MMSHLYNGNYFYSQAFLYWNTDITFFMTQIFTHRKTVFNSLYRKSSNIRFTLAGNKIVDHSDVVGASPIGAAPTTSSFST